MALLNIINDNFKNAIIDYSYLIERNFSYKSIIKIVGDKYKLSKTQRTILTRGITKKSIASSRNKKNIKLNKSKNKILLIDTYNVLITINSYLDGVLLFIGNDGFLRDAAETHGQIKNTEKMQKCLTILLEYINKLKINEVIFYLDSPISYSKVLSNIINKKLTALNINGVTKVVKSPDYELSISQIGICATSDSVIIDKKNEILDLAKNVLKYKFKPKFIFLNKYLKK